LRMEPGRSPSRNTLDHLHTAVTDSIDTQRGNQALLRSFFEYAQLPL
jgi:hypothetical protein